MISVSMDISKLPLEARNIRAYAILYHRRPTATSI